MALAAAYLPFSTELDPTEAPPTGVDPLGTLGDAERLADVLLPGFTARMWRLRLVTFATLAAEVADRVVKRVDGREDLRVPARMAFERLYVSAVVRAARDNPKAYSSATRNLPGQTLASAALDADEPLGTSNFLRGQAVNGPSGVMVRLVRTLGLVDDRWAPAAQAPKVLGAWAEDRGLPGLLDDDGSSRPGALWMELALKHTTAHLTKGEWPGPNQKVWDQLAVHLRPDRTGANERRELGSLLDGDAVRARVLGALCDSARAFQAHERPRGEVERAVLLENVRDGLGRDPVDRVISAALTAVDAYEAGVALLEQAFDAVRWGLRGTGQSTVAALVALPSVAKLLARTRSRLSRAGAALDRAAAMLREQPRLDSSAFTDPLERLRADAIRATASDAELVAVLLDRHEAVQRAKRKGVWVDRADRLTLMPGFGLGTDGPAIYEGAFRHPFRVLNAYAFLDGLKRIAVEVPDGEA